MNNKSKTTIMTSVIMAVSLGLLTPGLAEANAASYYSGNHWSFTDHDHTNELHNGSVPIKIDTARLSQHLDLASGTSISDIYNDIEKAIAAIDATDMNLVRKDTATQDHDNKISSEDLSQRVYGATKDKLIHFKLAGFNSGYDNHLLRSNVFLNDDGNDFTWSHNNGDSYNDVIHTYNLVLHELGHVIGLCDTYRGGSINKGSCTGVIDTNSIMSNTHTFKDSERSLTSTDRTTINGAY